MQFNLHVHTQDHICTHAIHLSIMCAVWYLHGSVHIYTQQLGHVNMLVQLSLHNPHTYTHTHIHRGVIYHSYGSAPLRALFFKPTQRRAQVDEEKCSMCFCHQTVLCCCHCMFHNMLSLKGRFTQVTRNVFPHLPLLEVQGLLVWSKHFL